MTTKKTPWCCEVLEMVIERSGEKGPLRIEQAFSLTGKPTRELLTYRFPKAKRGSEGKFGPKSEWGNASYAVCKVCPFCGAKQASTR
jgi:hypothetical protein